MKSFIMAVDTIKLFDSIKQFGSESVGQRLVELCLAPQDHTFFDAVGLEIYGIQVFEKD